MASLKLTEKPRERYFIPEAASNQNLKARNSKFGSDLLYNHPNHRTQKDNHSSQFVLYKRPDKNGLLIFPNLKNI